VVVVNTALGVRSVSATRLLVAASFRSTLFQRLRFVIVQDALPQVFIGLRTALSLAIVVAVVSEMLLSTGAGIGATIYNNSMMYRTEHAYVGVFLAGGLGYFLNLLMARLDEAFVHWRGR
jgi:ABC-type nitrate/sulfonate/bicarbonate transport system permease component